MTAIYMIRLGITGTIGSGKTTIGKLLQEKGFPVIDTDKIVDDLYVEDDVLKTEFERHFGKAVFDESGHISKERLRPYVFANPDSRQLINELVHPRVREKVDLFFSQPTQDANAHLLRAVLVPLLFESDTRQRYDTVWTVTTEEPVLIQRLLAREHLDPDDAQSQASVVQKIQAQWSQSKKASLADTVIDNSGTLSETAEQVDVALANLLSHPSETSV